MSQSRFSIDDIRTMISSIRSSDKNARMNSLSNLRVIAQTLGPDRTRSELIPFTIDTTDHDEDALRKIAKELGLMLSEVGGAQHASVLTSSLRYLCENEDPRVSKPATDSLIKISKLLSPADLETVYLEFTKELCEDDWYPLRCAGARLICELYSRMPETANKLIIKCIATLAIDKIVLVRKSLVIGMVQLLKSVRDVSDIISKILQRLASDSAPAVAIEIPEVLVVLAQLQPALAESLARCIFDGAVWQARSVLVSNLHRIFDNTKPRDFLKTVARESSMETSSNSIRTAIAKQIGFIHSSNCFSDAEFTDFVNVLISDADPCVRTSTAVSLSSLPSSISSFVESSLVILLNDDEMDVKMAALQSVASTGSGITAAAANLAELIRFSNWRVKKGIAELVPRIAETMTSDLFDSELMPIVKDLFEDEAADVRSAVIKSLSVLVSRFGVAWRASSVETMLRAAYESRDYQLRKSAVTAIAELHLTKELSDVVEKAARDAVPNVRMVLARELPRESAVLKLLQTDADPDVAFYASRK